MKDDIRAFELQVAICGLQCGLQVARCGWQVARCRLQAEDKDIRRAISGKSLDAGSNNLFFRGVSFYFGSWQVEMMS